MEEIELNEAIVFKAIQLKQSKRLSLGDAIVAATAVEGKAILYTANTDDFKNIPGLKVVNPLEK